MSLCLSLFVSLSASLPLWEMTSCQGYNTTGAGKIWYEFCDVTAICCCPHDHDWVVGILGHQVGASAVLKVLLFRILSLTSIVTLVCRLQGAGTCVPNLLMETVNGTSRTIQPHGQSPTSSATSIHMCPPMCSPLHCMHALGLSMIQCSLPPCSSGPAPLPRGRRVGQDVCSHSPALTASQRRARGARTVKGGVAKGMHLFSHVVSPCRACILWCRLPCGVLP